MNDELKDKGLKKAVKEQSSFKLSSNFAYQTMQKIEVAIHLREKKTDRRTLWATIIAAVCIVGCSIAGLIIYFGNSIREAFTRTSTINLEEFQMPSFYILLIIAVPFFLLFDRWMRKQYFKRHS